MANLIVKDGIYAVRFRFQGREYKRSLKTRSQSDARIAQKLVEVTIHRLLTGQCEVPPAVDVGEFIVSGGTAKPKTERPPAPIFPATRELIERYLAAKLNTISENYFTSQKIHLNHLTKFLGADVDRPCCHVTQRKLEEYLLGRLKIRDPGTVARERVTLLQFYKWVASRQDVAEFPSPIVGLPTFKSVKDQSAFRTIEEIEAILARGGLSEDQAADAWECLFLSPQEIAGLLSLVNQRAVDHRSFMLHVIPAYTGMRRGEILRLAWADVDFEHGYVTARSRKQSQRRHETQRRIDLHAELKQHLSDWRKQRSKGQWVISDGKTSNELRPDQANLLFWKPMRHTCWCLNSSRNWFKIGFHTYRHSFASNLASLGVDQRVIDEFMGHQTEEMRKRYRHLFPKQRRSAIESFSLLAPPASVADGQGGLAR